MLREQLQSAQVVAIGLEVGGWRLRQGLLLGALQVDLQRRNDLVRDVILDGEDVGQRSVIALCPDLAAIGAVDQPGRNSDPVAGAPDASFEHIGDLQAGAGIHGVASSLPHSEAIPRAATCRPEILERSVIRSSATPSLK